MSHFDYENAERDIFDAGGDPDYLSHYNEAARDRYLKRMGLNPRSYGGGSPSSEKSKVQSSKSKSASYLSDYDSSHYTWSSSGSMSLSEWRKSLKEDRMAREVAKYMQKTPDEIEKDSSIIKAFAIFWVIYLIVAVVSQWF